MLSVLIFCYFRGLFPLSRKLDPALLHFNITQLVQMPYGLFKASLGHMQIVLDILSRGFVVKA